MKRFMGMMPIDEIAKEQAFKDRRGFRITVQAGPNGWTVLWADHSSDYKDVTATTEENWKAALAYLANKGFEKLESASTLFENRPRRGEMIGGHDMIFPLVYEESRELRQQVLDHIREAWRDAVFEWDESDIVTRVDELGQIVNYAVGLFAYRTRADQSSWNRDGRTDDNHDRMIYIIFRGNESEIGGREITCVVSETDGSETERIVRELFKKLSHWEAERMRVDFEKRYPTGEVDAMIAKAEALLARHEHQEEPLVLKLRKHVATEVKFDAEYMIVVLGDNDAHLRLALSDFPKLRDATPEQRVDWHLIGEGSGIHWPQLDEDLSVAGLFAKDRSKKETP